VNQGFPKIPINLSGYANWLIILAVVWLLGSIGLGWIVNSILIFLCFLIIAPVIALLIARWWLNRNIIQSNCPVCDYEFVGLNNTECQCPNCGEQLKIAGGLFQRLTPPGTIDVMAVEVGTKQLED
jgi:Zn finger protein HypA/HybF involved in hydrogenase expression